MITAAEFLIMKIETLAFTTKIELESRRPLDRHSNESLYGLLSELIIMDYNIQDFAKLKERSSKL